MIQQKKINVERILRVNRVGAWRIEIEDGKSPRFYADAVMDELLGIQGEISPEERFTFHRRVYIRMICSYFWNIQINCQRQNQKSYIAIFILHLERCSYVAVA